MAKRTKKLGTKNETSANVGDEAQLSGELRVDDAECFVERAL